MKMIIDLEQIFTPQQLSAMVGIDQDSYDFVRFIEILAERSAETMTPRDIEDWFDV